MMARLAILFIVLLIGPALGCADHGDKELFETAQFEERQNNRDHAKALYQELLTKHPTSEYAKKAEVRLKALNQ